jgi:hypothetical protein
VSPEGLTNVACCRPSRLRLTRDCRSYRQMALSHVGSMYLVLALKFAVSFRLCKVSGITDAALQPARHGTTSSDPHSSYPR